MTVKLVLYLTYFVVYASSLNILSLNTDNNIGWLLENQNGSIKVSGSVPGGVYSDLEKAGVIGNIFERFNDVLTRWIAYDTWSYSANFTVPKEFLEKRVANLVLHGVDTIAYVELNNRPVGRTDNMFIRYVFDIKTYLKEGRNEIKITFDSPVVAAKKRSDKNFTPPQCVPDEYHGECHANQLRKMQASFSWDWGPAFPSVGLWKDTLIEFYDNVIIRSVTTNITKNNDRWVIKTKVYIESAMRTPDLDGQLQAVLYIDNERYVKLVKDVVINMSNEGIGESEIEVSVSENVITLWWPNGFGNQQLYSLDLRFTSDRYPEEVASKMVKVGFRTVELVEDDPTIHLGNASSSGLTFYFKINGYPLFMKGTNWIPSHILPEFADNKDTIDNLLESSRDAHMAMIRVWGGGIYEPDYFYQRCDELGILIWQDLLFACSMYPVDAEFLSSVKKEIEQNVLRLQHHPSIAVWAGNNENEGALRDNWYGTAHDFDKYKTEYVKLYVDIIKPIVEYLDPGRRYLVSSPSNGIESEKEGYVAERPSDPHYGDTHYYNYVTDNWDMNTYPKSRFASEYGYQSLPSLATMRKATNLSTDFAIESDYSVHRQHSPLKYDPIKNLILRHLKLEDSEHNYFEKFVFYSQISQAMSMKAETEFYRQSQSDWYTMGALYWQLNDVWQAPSWSGIEYGGKWKLLHYFAKSFFAPVLVSPRRLVTGDIDVYLINDRFVPLFGGEIKVDYFTWNNLVPFKSESYKANVDPLTAKKQLRLNTWKYSRNETVFFRFSLKAEGVISSPFNYVFPVPLKNIQGLQKPEIKISVSSRTSQYRNRTSYIVDLNINTVVLFLWLETDDIDGQFEDNGFIVTQPYIRVNYLTKEDITPELLQNKINYKYYLN